MSTPTPTSASATAPQKNNHLSTIPPTAMPLISPPALLHAHLTQNRPLRPSSRLPNEGRRLALNTSSLTHANGSALLRAGTTAIVCGVRAELLAVDSIADYRVKDLNLKRESGQEGKDEDYSEVIKNRLLVPNIELSTGCSAAHLPGGPPSVEAQSLAQRLLGLLQGTQVVRADDLKIYYTPPTEGLGIDTDTTGGDETPQQQLKAYWVLYIDVWCISYGGNIFDAAWLVVLAALRDTLLPKAWWDADAKQIICSAEREEGRKLTLMGMPVSLTWAVFTAPGVKDGKKLAKPEKHWVLVDPDAFEEECCLETGCVVVDFSERGIELLKLESSGGGQMDAGALKEILAVAEKRWSDWGRILEAGG